MFEIGRPYMTVYDVNQIQCSNHCIAKNVYSARGPRSTQYFLCQGPGGRTIAVFNVHAPSGSSPLTDKQRRALLRKLLQRRSIARQENTVGNSSFLVGGDMSTDRLVLTDILTELRQDNILCSKEIIMEPRWAKHSDLCIKAGFPAICLRKQARNHDPRHVFMA